MNSLYGTDDTIQEAIIPGETMSGYVEVEVDGKLYRTEYHITDGVLTVYGNKGSEFTTINGMEEQALAKMLLRRLAKRGDVDPERN